ncbi:MAG: nuclear transport factor 2 family protein [Pleurocapsa sp. MO_192.B19]|nr:nuclear transport factor 2 family protein [Pleurocapsa sp. MO_192.B19]
MKTDKLKINQLSPQVYDWYLSYLKAIDTKNIETYGNFLADKCVMQFNNDSYEGKTAILQNIAEYWTTFDSITHDLLNIYGTDSSFVLEALNHYQRNDNKTVTVRAVAITDRNEKGLVTSFRLYSDTTPLS